MVFECLVQRILRDRPMRSTPRRLAVFHEDRLRGFVLYPKPSGDRIGDFAMLDHENQAAGNLSGRSREARELFVGFAADRALRAMLENKNGIGLRSIEKLFEIFVFA